MSHIELVDVSVQFETKNTIVDAVKDVSLKIERGDLYGIVGLSGAGKSTLLRTFNLLQKPSSGQVFIDGNDITQLSKKQLREQRQHIGMIFQHFNLIANKTIAQNLAFALKASHFPKAKRSNRVKELLKTVGLSDKAHVYPSHLSGGQKQRVGIARALANQPEILLCDEATSALDVETTEEIVQLLKKINKEFGITIVFITHEMDVAKKLFHHIAVMDNGEIVEKGATFDIFSDPKARMTKKLVNRSLALDIPEELFASLTEGELVTIHYQGSGTVNPIISTLSKNFDVFISIIHGKVDYIDGKALGILLVFITGNPNEVEASIEVLKEKVFLLERLLSKEEFAEVTNRESI